MAGGFAVELTAYLEDIVLQQQRTIQPFSLVCGLRFIGLVCLSTKLLSIYSASLSLVCGLSACHWLGCIPDLHVHKASEEIFVWPLQILLWPAASQSL